MKKKNSNALDLIIYIGWAVVISLVITLIVNRGSMFAKPERLSLAEVATLIKEDKVSKIEINGEDIVLTVGKEEQRATKEANTSFTETISRFAVTPEQLSKLDITVKSQKTFGNTLLRILPLFSPIILFLLIMWFLSKSMQGGGGAMKAFSFGQSKAKLAGEKDKKVTFNEVAGNKTAKNELREVVEFLKTPEKFFKVGAKIPKGVLLVGSPGTGKTLLARAVAGEAGVAFFHLSGSEFVEMFVGVGASRVRDLFDMARKTAPAIIFIDEIDAVGRSRGVGIGGGNDEREQTLNQILVEMDGFEPKEKLVVIAATNREDVLDPALLRPGRFDRRVFLDVPDRKDRKDILEIHAKNKPLEEGIDLAVVARRTSGFSGADLESLMNEAAIKAARRESSTISLEDILSSVDKVLIGPERLNHLHTEHERKLVAYHEAGHALLATLLPDADPVHRVSIVQRGNAGGYTMKLPLEEKKLRTRAEYFDDITMTLGGYVTEKLVFGDVSTGPSGDLENVTNVARAMVSRFGMSDTLGPVAYEVVNSHSIYADRTQTAYAEKTLQTIDAEVTRIITDALARAEKLVKENKNLLDIIANELLDKETLEQEEYEALLSQHGIVFKKVE
ncbi:MAG TPA: ATP-dependent zinc metalloprotease FtsH [Candidatus Paceibacterota bacterium]